MASGPSELLECRWGKLRLFAARINTDDGRTQVVHNQSSGDVHPVQDRGLREVRVRCQLQFDDFPGQPAPRDAALALRAAKNSGQKAVFQHPLIGRFLASVGEFHSEINESSIITAEAEFIQEAPDEPLLPTGAATGQTPGESAVSAAATAMDTQLANLGLLKMSSTAAGAVLAKVPGGSGPLDQLNAARGTINLTVAQAAAFAQSVTGQTTAVANAISSEASAIVGAPTATEFSAFAASSALNALLLSPAGENFQATTVVQPPSGLGARAADPSATLAKEATKEAQQGLFSATTMDARVSVSRWNQTEVTTREILIDAARISNNIATMIETTGLQAALNLYPAFRAAIMLGESVRQAASSAMADTPKVFLMRVRERCSLLALTARLYGGAQANERVRQILEMNDIATPGWLPPGDYVMPAKAV